MKEKRETPARSNSWHLWHFIQRKGVRVVKVSQQQTSVRATSAGLQLIDILTSYISWHLPVMDDIPLQPAIPASILCGRCLCAVYSQNTGTPSRACSESLAHIKALTCPDSHLRWENGQVRTDTWGPESANTLTIYHLGSGLGPEVVNRLMAEFKAEEKQEMQDCA